MRRSSFITALISITIFGVTALAHADSPAAPIIEGAVGGGFMAFEQMSVDQSIAKSRGNFIPYGKIQLRLGNGKFLRPEIIIEESGDFNFDKSGIKEGSQKSSYNNYYLKLPLGIPVPFFTYKSSLAFDGRYSTMGNGLRLEQTSYVNDKVYNPGAEFFAVSSEMMFRLYLNTPVVLNPTFFEYSYFGAFYAERVMPRTTNGPEGVSGAPNILVGTVTRTGGLFYDMKKDAFLKGLNIEVTAYLGYGDMFVEDSVSVTGVSFGNTKELITINGKVGINYRYIFKHNLGLDINTGVSYFVTTEFLGAPDKSKYSVNTGGDLRYFATVSFVFGY